MPTFEEVRDAVRVIATGVTAVSGIMQLYRWFEREQKKRRRKQRLAMSQKAGNSSMAEPQPHTRVEEEWQDWLNQELRELRNQGLPKWKIKIVALGWRYQLIQAHFLMKVTDLLVRGPRMRK